MKDQDAIIENVFKTSHEKNALLSYIIYPFTGPMQNSHSNHRECYTMVEILSELGYNVDVINWNNNAFTPSKKYDLVIDNHNNLERLLPYLDGQAKKIFHATNAHWLSQNSVEYSRAEDYFVKKGIVINPSRLLSPGNSFAFCDAISMFGNDFTESTYGVYAHKVYHLPMSVTTEAEQIPNRYYPSAKKKFLWLNSHGALLKGMDIVIDAFALMPALELHICSNLERDSEFIASVSSQLSAAPNIKMEGWVDINSSAFNNLVTECGWIINTSFSEGGGGSTLNCMAKGLIPVVSRSASITLPGNTGFYIENNNASSLVALLKTISVLPDDVLKEMSFNAYNFIAANHTLENFKKKYKEFLIRILQPVGDQHD
jgi:glycosyltransferase involved in cell wall biosynthesis